MGRVRDGDVVAGQEGYFNNDWEAFAVKNALWLKERPHVSATAKPAPGRLRAARDATIPAILRVPIADLRRVAKRLGDA